MGATILQCIKCGAGIDYNRGHWLFEHALGYWHQDPLACEAASLRAENARLREALTAITDEFEATVRHCDNDGKGMQVPFHGDFAGAKQMPSIANRIRWWARFLRAALDAKEGE